MNTIERTKFIEQVGFKINKEEIIDNTTKEKLKIKQDNFEKTYIGKNSEVYIKNPNQLTIRKKDIIIKLKENSNEKTIIIKDKNTMIEITTTLEGMMYKIGGIIIKQTTEKNTIKTKYIQRIEQAEINNIKIKLPECNPEIITEILLKHIKNKEIIKPIIQENIIKILNHLQENINKYLEGLEIENNKPKIKILKQYQRQ